MSSSVMISRDALSLVLAFLPSREIGLSASRVSKDWNRAAATAWRHVTLQLDTQQQVDLVPPAIRRVVADLEVSGALGASTCLEGFSSVRRLHLARVTAAHWDLHGLLRPPQQQNDDAPVTELSLDWLDTTMRKNNSQAGLFFTHPRLQSLQQLCARDIFPVARTGLSSLAQLRRLVLGLRCVVDDQQLWNAIQSLEQLTTIETPSSDSPMDSTPFPPALTHLVVRPRSDILALLMPLHNQLRHIDLRCSLVSHDDDDSALLEKEHAALFEFVATAPELLLFACRRVRCDNIRDLIRRCRSTPSSLRPTSLALQQPDFPAHSGLTPQIRSIVLERRRDTPSDLDSDCDSIGLPPLDHLTSLSFDDDSDIGYRQITDLLTTMRPTLVSLVVPSIRMDARDNLALSTNIWMSIARHRSLESLSLFVHSPIEDSGITLLAELPRLRKVILAEVNAMTESATACVFQGKTAAALVKMASLKELHLSNCLGLCEPDRLCMIVRSCTSLRRLTVDPSSIHDYSPAVFEEMKRAAHSAPPTLELDLPEPPHERQAEAPPLPSFSAQRKLKRRCEIM